MWIQVSVDVLPPRLLETVSVADWLQLWVCFVQADGKPPAEDITTSTRLRLTRTVHETHVYTSCILCIFMPCMHSCIALFSESVLVLTSGSYGKARHK